MQQVAYNFTRGFFGQPKSDPNAVKFLKFQNELLLIATSRSIQVWSIDTGLYKCIFNKIIPEVCLLEVFGDAIAYVTFEQKTQINFHSYKSNRTRHVHMTASPIRKILSAANVFAILQLDSTLQVLDSELAVVTQLKTFQVNRELFPNIKEIEVKTDFILCQLGFPIDFSISQNYLAYSSTIINKQSLVDSVIKQFNQTSLSQNYYLREFVQKSTDVLNQGAGIVNALVRIQNALKQDDQIKQVCWCNQPPTQSKTQIASKKNKKVIVLRDLNNLDVRMEIKPTHMKAICLVSLSPSARHLITGNDLGQYYYVYELFPAKNKRNSCPCVVQYRLEAVLFRGRTPNSITDCSMKYSGEDLFVILNSSSGTSHVFLVRNQQNQMVLGQPSQVKNLNVSCIPIKKQAIGGHAFQLATLQKGSRVFSFSTLNQLHEFQLSESNVLQESADTEKETFENSTSIHLKPTNYQKQELLLSQINEVNLVEDYFANRRVEIIKVEQVQESYYNQMTYRGSLERCIVLTADTFTNSQDYQRKNYLSVDLVAELDQSFKPPNGHNNQAKASQIDDNYFDHQNHNSTHPQLVSDEISWLNNRWDFRQDKPQLTQSTQGTISQPQHFEENKTDSSLKSENNTQQTKNNQQFDEQVQRQIADLLLNSSIF